MDDIGASLLRIAVPGLDFAWDPSMHVASLRCLETAGAFASAVQTLLGGPLPAPLRARMSAPAAGEDAAILAWRAPTETLLLCSAAGIIERIADAVAVLDDGCVVDQTGGAWVMRANGAGVAELFARLGGQGMMPAPGESRPGRLAEIPALAMQARPGEVLVIVERVYGEHLMAWARASAADMGRP